MKRLLIFQVALLLLPLLVFAQPQQSENFRITKSVLDAGGGLSTSENFRLVSAFGQPTPVGVQSSENFVLSAGFLSPEFLVSPLSPIQDLVIQTLGTTVRLDWGAIASANSYNVYRDSVATFTPDVSHFLGSTADNFFEDATALTLPHTTYYYIVTSSDSPPALSIKQKREPFMRKSQ